MPMDHGAANAIVSLNEVGEMPRDEPKRRASVAKARCYRGVLPCVNQSESRIQKRVDIKEAKP